MCERNHSGLFFTCALVEQLGRDLKMKRCDVVKALDSTGFTEVAEALLNMLKQRVSGDYLHTAAILDKDFHVHSSVNNPNTYQGPGTGYRLDGAEWERVKNIPQAFDCASIQ